MDRKLIASGEKGATMIEYALTIALISAASIFSLSLIGAETNKSFASSAEAFDFSRSIPGGEESFPGTIARGSVPGGGSEMGSR